MNKWRVIVIFNKNQKSINKYFHNKSEAMKYFNNYIHSTTVELLKYNGTIWVSKKIHFKYEES